MSKDLSKEYGPAFFESRSREVGIAETVLRPLISLLRPKSVVDFGTATGSWLAASKRLGVQKIGGIDGPWVPAEQRLIAPHEFTEANFEEELPDLGRFDLAISAEVLEHISGPASLRAVEWLCRSAPAVLFSAAIPFQGGMHHINEQWQSHWANAFETYGFKAYDIIRPVIWTDTSIPVYYRQNLILLADDETARNHGLVPVAPAFLDRVHPEEYFSKLTKLKRRTITGRIKWLLAGMHRPERSTLPRKS
ncbi:class I SAM-dependent methyltransferase [Mesorhizobium sp. M0293]|uniref:methyltransferase domain-containing protein n=1 Tax=unclassified Mesorhizobium TaxID=325217 RepID=UPI003335627B